MYLVTIAWLYVALMMAAAEATSPNGTVLGAVFTLLLYGVMPLAIVLYLMATPQRRRMRRAREQAQSQPLGGSAQPDSRDHAARDAVAPVRKEP